MSDVTRVLSRIDQGDPHAAEQLLSLVYDELRKLAAQKPESTPLRRRLFLSSRPTPQRAESSWAPTSCTCPASEGATESPCHLYMSMYTYLCRKEAIP